MKLAFDATRFIADVSWKMKGPQQRALKTSR
jgi:hypothetical protein